MIYTSLRRTDQFAFLRSSDGVEYAFPWVFLKDNDPAGFHETAGERTFDLLAIDLDISPQHTELAENGLIIKWPDQQQPSLYSFQWLAEHTPGFKHPDSADFPPVLWDQHTMPTVTVFQADKCLDEPSQMLEMLHRLKATGVVIVDGLVGEGAGLSFGEEIGALRATNFGVHFSVHTKPNANNLAYTSRALPLHTDLPNQLYPPDFQFLHCVDNSAEGGDSQLVDGWKVAEDIRREEPEIFSILSSIPIPFRFRDSNSDIISRRPCIELDDRGRIVQLSFSGHLAAPFDMPADQMISFYHAFRMLMKRLREPRYCIDLKMKSGQMMIMNNRRVLHGRSAFSASGGARQLIGFYIDKAELDSRYRVLKNRLSEQLH